MTNSKSSSLLTITIGLSSLVAGARSASPKVLKLPFSVAERVHDSNLTRREPAHISLTNNGIGYLIETTLGTPGQTMQLQLDTGSSDSWAFGPGSCSESAEQCEGGQFDITKSSSAKVVEEGGLYKTYAKPGTKVQGDYITDTMRIGDITMNDKTFAVATYTTGETHGILGLGPAVRQSATTEGGESYPTILDRLVEQGTIKARAFSVWLDSADATTGNILFGGYDEGRFEGELVTYPMVKRTDGQAHRLALALSRFSTTSSDGEKQEVATASSPKLVSIDTGSTLCYLPPALANLAAESAGAVWQESVSAYSVDCEKHRALNGTVDFGFTDSNNVEGPEISVPLAKLLREVKDDDGNPACYFGISTYGENKLNSLGDTFMRSVYVVYDLDKQEISMAPGIPGSQGGSVREIVSEDAGNDQREGGENGGAAARAPDMATLLVLAGLIFLNLFDDIPLP